MAKYSYTLIKNKFDNSVLENNSYKRGKILEELTCYLFQKVPGITHTFTNVVNVAKSEEIDIAFWNDRLKKGFWFLPPIIFVECKNTQTPVASKDVEWFVYKLRERSNPFGFLIATNGISGEPQRLDSAHDIVRSALKDGIKLIVVTKKEILALNRTVDLIELTKKKICMLSVKGTCF